MAAEPGTDPAALVSDVSREVSARRDAGAYPRALVDLLATPFSRSDASAAPESLAHIASARELVGRGPLGAAKVAAQRVARRLLGWYITPITADQTRFNDAILAELRRLEARLLRLEPISPPLLDLDAAVNLHLGTARSALLTALQETGSARVLLVGGTSVPDGADDAVATLSRVEAASLDGVYLAGVMPCLGARAMIDVAALAATRIRPGGWVAADTPDAGNADAPRDPGLVAFGMQRWIDPDLMTFVLESAGLVGARTCDVSRTTGGRAWFAVVAERPVG